MEILRAKKINEYERFMALSDAQKDAEVAQVRVCRQAAAEVRQGHGSARPRQGPPNPPRSLPRRRPAGRPMVGKGAKIVPVSIERGSLEKADSFAPRHNPKRSHMVADGLCLVMPIAKAS